MTKAQKAKIERLNEIDPEIVCGLCIYKDGCSHGVACYGGEPSFPPCSNGDYTHVNWEAVDNYKEDQYD